MRETVYETREQRKLWASKDKWPIPMKFPPNWNVQMIPPTGGAMVRFLVHCDEFSVSVYYDIQGALGAMSEPYWEVYPNAEGDNERFLRGEESDMIAAIQKTIDYHTKSPLSGEGMASFT